MPVPPPLFPRQVVVVASTVVVVDAGSEEVVVATVVVVPGPPPDVGVTAGDVVGVVDGGAGIEGMVGATTGGGGGRRGISVNGMVAPVVPGGSDGPKRVPGNSAANGGAGAVVTSATPETS